MSRSFFSLNTLLALSLLGCGMPAGAPPISHNQDNHHTPQASSSPNVAMQDVKIKFAAQVNGEGFDCNRSYSNVGTSKSTIQPQDFRFYLSHIRLVNAAGEEIHITLDENNWQNDHVALLDFENKTGTCDSGTPDTHSEITGKIPAGTYKGLKFELGVPMDMNHQDVNAATAPLNLSSMFWVWRSGYKFTRLDFKSTGLPQGFALHLGSTACTGNATASTTPSEHSMHTKQHNGHGETNESATTAPMSCAYPNRVKVSFPQFEITQTVVADLGRLVSETNVDSNQADSPAGCMSGNDDADCKGIFKKFGLSFGSQVAQEQGFFAIQP